MLMRIEMTKVYGDGHDTFSGGGGGDDDDTIIWLGILFEHDASLFSNFNLASEHEHRLAGAVKPKLRGIESWHQDLCQTAPERDGLSWLPLEMSKPGVFVASKSGMCQSVRLSEVHDFGNNKAGQQWRGELSCHHRESIPGPRPLGRLRFDDTNRSYRRAQTAGRSVGGPSLSALYAPWVYATSIDDHFKA